MLAAAEYQYNFSKWWITGFTQSDGSFIVMVKRAVRAKFGFTFKPTFELTQSIVDIDIIIALHKHLGVGNLVLYKGNISIVVTSLDELINVIIPHFDKYPLQGGKLESYLIFRHIVFEMKKNTKGTVEGFYSMLFFSYFMNTTSIRTPMNLFAIVLLVLAKSKRVPDSIPVITVDEDLRAKITANQSMNNDFVAGIYDGDGHIGFGFDRRNNPVCTSSVTMETADKAVLDNLRVFFGTGVVNKIKGRMPLSSKLLV